MEQLLSATQLQGTPLMPRANPISLSYIHAQNALKVCSVIWAYLAQKSFRTLISWQDIHTTITDTSTVPLQFDFFTRVVCSNKRLTYKQLQTRVSPTKTPPKRQGMWEQGILCTFPGTVPFEAQTQQKKKLTVLLNPVKCGNIYLCTVLISRDLSTRRFSDGISSKDKAN